MKWLEKERPREIIDSFEEAQQLLHVLRWSEETEISGANRSSTHDFAAYLSNNDMMNTFHIDMMFAHISDRVEEDPGVDCSVAVETLRFWRELDKATSAKYFETYTSRFMHRLEKRLKDGEIAYLVFPVYFEKLAHWLVFKIDVESEQISYGKSMETFASSYTDTLALKVTLSHTKEWPLQMHAPRRFFGG
ncbi:hypothetical protein BDN70DRAFT_887167 [Pholiota conissans]|uniref:Ubiquitin-like protease family profile domain-containing protein n=1 Tax=Pholiota conissans TaxID=109636 RepID=A0A9P5YQW9_9AGAR|nr:hypothetical protein BDN70DRAFT_887167 [Pholiota conissans]